MSTNIYAQLDEHFRGYARIRLDDIEFESGRDLDSRNIRRLLGKFKRKCERENPGNAIPVVVKEDILANLSQRDLHPETIHSLVPDELPYLETKVLCLHGKHRIYAARKFLSHSDSSSTSSRVSGRPASANSFQVLSAMHSATRSCSTTTRACTERITCRVISGRTCRRSSAVLPLKKS